VENSTSTRDGIIRNPEAYPDQLEGGPWDGRNFGYIPPPELSISPDLELHEEFDLDLDPITYEVLRNRFWNLNLDHSDTIRRVSGTAVIAYMDDFNTSLLAENGDNLVCGPSIQYFTGHGDHIVKWTLEHRSVNPGIEDGDVFLQNDPYIGSAHQMDVAVYAPLFLEGRIFCWILSSCHVGDIGGTIPGSFISDAPDIFHESTPVPPIKVVRRGVLQEDVADSFTRKSRLPDLLALQLRSQTAGIRATRTRLEGILAEFGPATVKGAMRRMIRDCSRTVGERLSQLPDGHWEQTVFIGSAGPDDRAAHRLRTEVEKVGDRLYLSNEGTDPQFWAANCTYAAWRSASLCAIVALLAWDQRFCPAGVSDHVEFWPTLGTITACTFPGAVTPIQGNVMSIYLASQAVSKMLLCGPEELRARAVATGGVSLPGWWVASGLDRNGNFVTDLTGDSLNGSIGAFANRDGVDTGGAFWWPRTNSGNAEEWEQSIPFIYLYRREMKDSGGSGRWRGGNGCEIAVIGHKTTELTAAVVSADPALNTSPGLAGGHPGHPGNYLAATDSGVRERFQDRRFPATREQLLTESPAVERISPKAAVRLLEDDVLVVEYSAGGGYGDPLTRDPDLVKADVDELRVSAGNAERAYGVVFGGDLEVEHAASSALRERRREERLGEARMPAESLGTVDLERAEVALEPFDGLLVVEGEGGRRYACGTCGECLGPADGNYKEATAILEDEPSEIDELMYPPPSDFCDDPIVLRRYACPGCGVLLGAEFCPPDDPPSWDLRLGYVRDGRGLPVTALAAEGHEGPVAS
jgi:N-methylhydantoinase B